MVVFADEIKIFYMDEDYESSDLITEICKRPAIFLGDQEGGLGRFAAMMVGAHMALRSSPEVVAELEQMVPPNFHEFVERHFGIPNPGGWGWQTYIANEVGTGVEALELFSDLKALCEESLKSNE
ncbi:MAG: hypothetical protein ACI9NQ_001121 [Paracoccaceae bacterium]